MRAGTVLNTRRKGSVTWQARIGTDRDRLEVIGVVAPSTTATEIEPLTEYELLELLGESGGLRQTPGRVE